MSDRVPDILLTALRAGNFDSPLREELASAVRDGDVAFSDFGFDSLGVMEFCISIELQSGLELTPAMVAEMRQIADIERWLRDRL